MMAGTHAAIGVVGYAGLCAIMGQTVEPVALGAAALGSWMPDVDTPSSKAGFCVYPLARFLERRFGHRTVTHSLVGVLCFAAMWAPLFFFPRALPLFAPLLCGYILHLLGDAATKSGVPLFWPNRARCVFPGNEALRLKTGSLAEVGVLACVLLIGALIVPLAQQGPRRLLHLATGSMFGAVRDAEEWSADYELEAEVEGYNVMAQSLVSGRFRVVGRRGDGKLIIEAQEASTGAGAGYWLLAETGDEPYRIAPRRVRIEKRSPRATQTKVLRVSNITLGALSRALVGLVPTAPLAEPKNAEEAARMTDGFGPNDLLISGQAECYAFPQDPASAPVDTPASGLKTVTFAGTRATFDFAQPRHLTSAGNRIAIKSATLTIQVPRGATIARLNLAPLHRIIAARSMRRHSDLLVRAGDLVRRGQRLSRPFAQKLQHEMTPEEQRLENRAEAAGRELEALDVEERAMKRSALWAQFASSFAQRRSALQTQASWRAPQAAKVPLPLAAIAPFDGVIESIEWEPPTLPVQRGEVAEHAAQIAVARIQR